MGMFRDFVPGRRYKIAFKGNKWGAPWVGVARYVGQADDTYPAGTLEFRCEDGETGFFGSEDVTGEVNETSSFTQRPDLKRVLMELGNKMVTEHGFRPAIGERHGSIGDHTECIRCFTEWMNYHSEAREALKELGFDWSM